MYENVIIEPLFCMPTNKSTEKENNPVNFTWVIYQINSEMLLILFLQTCLKDLQNFLQDKNLLSED